MAKKLIIGAAVSFAVFVLLAVFMLYVVYLIWPAL